MVRFDIALQTIELDELTVAQKVRFRQTDHDYNSGFTDWRYQSAFAELEPQNPRQKDNWEKNRKEVYDISLTKFIKSLYNNTLTGTYASFKISTVRTDNRTTTRIKRTTKCKSTITTNGKHDCSVVQSR